MPNLDKSAPGGREAAQENFAKPGTHGANQQKNHHGAQGQAQQNELVPNRGQHSFKKGE